jgi:predicted NBD/HSP70 family sugar kinase
VDQQEVAEGSRVRGPSRVAPYGAVRVRATRVRILVIDVGGTNIKVLATGRRRRVKIPSGPDMTPARMVRRVHDTVRGWRYDVVSIGYPGPVRHGAIVSNPKNLGRGWTGFNFRRAFRRPVRIVNDAAMQALGSYRGGRMLFLGFGTGLGTAMILDGVIAPMEAGHLPYRRGRTFEQYVGEAGLARLGKKRWRRHALRVIAVLGEALQADEVVIGGGNARLIKRLPKGVRRVTNDRAFAGGFRLWSISPDGKP